jgi:hypothetical protein
MRDCSTPKVSCQNANQAAFHLHVTHHKRLRVTQRFRQYTILCNLDKFMNRISRIFANTKFHHPNAVEIRYA